jgi:hypothetical protein
MGGRLAVIMDMYTRVIRGWALEATMSPPTLRP